MELTRTQLKTILENAPRGYTPRQVVEGLVQRGYNIEGVDPLATSLMREMMKGTAPQQEERPKGMWEKANNVLASIVGGGELAKGLGEAVASGTVRRSFDGAFDSLLQTQSSIIQKLKEQTANGEDTSRTKALLKLNQIEIERLGELNKRYAEALPTAKQVVSSASRLATTVAAPQIGKAVSAPFKVGQAATTLSGVARGAGAGAASGGVIGSLQAAEVAGEKDLSASEIATAGAVGAAGGALFGGIVGGVTGGIVGFKNSALERKLDMIRPDTKKIPKTQYDKLVNQGRIEPRTMTSPDKYVLSKREAEAFAKYNELVEKNPIKTKDNINKKIGSLDKNVGTFLKENNGKYGKTKLVKRLKENLNEITDVTIPEARLEKHKNMLIDQFIKKAGDDKLSLWQTRKEYDASIKRIFSGSKTIQNEIKKTLRNVVQDYLAETTPNNVYAEHMKDMSGLYDLRDLVGIKSSVERGQTGFELMLKKIPIPKARSFIAGGGLVAGYKYLRGRGKVSR